MAKKRKSHYAPYEGGKWWVGDTTLKQHQNMPPGERAAKLRAMIQHAESRAAQGLRVYAALVPVYKVELAGLTVSRDTDRGTLAEAA